MAPARRASSELRRSAIRSTSSAPAPSAARDPAASDAPAASATARIHWLTLSIAPGELESAFWREEGARVYAQADRYCYAATILNTAALTLHASRHTRPGAVHLLDTCSPGVLAVVRLLLVYPLHVAAAALAFALLFPSAYRRTREPIVMAQRWAPERAQGARAAGRRRIRRAEKRGGGGRGARRGGGRATPGGGAPARAAAAAPARRRPRRPPPPGGGGGRGAVGGGGRAHAGALGARRPAWRMRRWCLVPWDPKQRRGVGRGLGVGQAQRSLASSRWAAPVARGAAHAPTCPSHLVHAPSPSLTRRPLPPAPGLCAPSTHR